MTFGSLVVFLVSFTSLVTAVTIVDHHPDEEYVIEHEISYKNAIEEAKKMKIYPGPIPGCKSCSTSEIQYCRDGDVMNDHCCCDNGSNDEVFRFVPHVCRIGPEVCKVRAGDCAEYSRLRECCCHSYHVEKWKNIANESTSRRDYLSFSVTLLLSGFLKVFLS